MTIALTKGHFAIIDQDVPLVSQFSWYALTNRSGNWYAYRNSNQESPHTTMHGMILDTFEEVDHINGNGLDNRKENLRIVTRRQNSYNRVGRVGKRFKGVSRIKRSGKWRAYIVLEGVQQHLGVFFTVEEAAWAYDRAAQQLYGQYARLNFPLQVVAA